MIHGKYIEVKPVIEKYLPKGVHVYYFCAGRGLGKTYSSLDICRELGTGDWLIDKTQETNKFLYTRRTGVEAKSVASPESCPFKKYNKNEGYDISADFSQDLGFGNFYLDEDHEEHIGYCAALSTFANLRGIDFSDVAFILYDECIPENKNKAPLKDEGFLLLNMLETINRNRALEGLTEVVLVLLSNPIDLGSTLLSQLNLTPILNNMILKNQQRYTDYSRSLHIEKLTDHPVSAEKRSKSMVYKFAAGTGFDEQALSGDFTGNDLTLIRPKVVLSEYRPYMQLENICVYQHKSNNTWYITSVCLPCRYTFKAYESEKVREVFYWKYKLLVVDRMVYYDNYQTKTIFEAMIKYKPFIS